MAEMLSRDREIATRSVLSDPTMYGVVAASILTVCVLASYVPARRITRVNPVDVLRAD